MEQTHASKKTLNALKVLELLINKEISRIDLSEETGLSTTTIGEIVRNFLQIGFIKEIKVKPKGIGRPITNLKLVHDYAFVIGIGIMRNGINGSLIDSEGKEIYRLNRPFREEISQIKIMYEVINDLLRKAEITNKKVKAISFGVPGPLDTIKGIIKEPPKLPEFANFHLIDKIKEKYNLFACLENDADMGAIGEKYYGKGEKLNSFIYIVCDKGIGAGIIINDSLYHGLNGYAGEIGHTPLLIKGKLVYFEEIYGMDKILTRINTYISSPISNSYTVNNLTKIEKESIDKIMKEISLNFSSIILTLIHYFGISNIFIDGRAKFLGNNFISSIKKTVTKYMFHKHTLNIYFSDLDGYAISLGAAKFGLIKLLQKIILEKIK